MDYDKFQKTMEKKKHGDGVSVGAGITGEYTLYGFFVLSIVLLFRVYSDILFVFVGISVIGFLLSVMPVIFTFEREHSTSINIQLFWISIFSGILSLIIYFSR